MKILDIECFPNFFQVGIMDENFTNVHISIDIKNDEIFNENKFNLLDDELAGDTIVTYNGSRYDDIMLSYLYTRVCGTKELYYFSKFVINQVDLKNSGFWNKSIEKQYKQYLEENYPTFTQKEIRGLIHAYKLNRGHTIPYYKYKDIFKLNSYPYDSIDLMKLVPSPGSLKMYGAMMDMNIQELPYHFDKNLSDIEIDNIIKYNKNDLDITYALYKRLEGDIALRDNLNKIHKVDTSSVFQDYRNKGNASLGLALLETKMSIPKSKVDKHYKFKLDLPDYLCFENEKLQQILELLKVHTFSLAPSTMLPIIVPEFLKEEIHLANCVFTLGMGGLHSNEKSLSVVAKEGETLRNIDVISYYPNIIFHNGFAPNHVDTKKYVNTLIDVFEERAIAKYNKKRIERMINDYDKYKKDRDRYIELLRETKNKPQPITKDDYMLLHHIRLIDKTNKIVLNGGGFGKLGDIYSKTFDPKAMANITITGQLSLLMLIEQLDKIEGVTILSSNTDGIELLDSNDCFEDIQMTVINWELATNLTMEYGEYKALHARDVNSYVAVYNGYTKAKGIYAEPVLGKSITHKIVYKAIRKYLLDATPLEDTINNCTDIKEFVTIAKVTGGAIANYTEILPNPLENVVKDGQIQFKVIPKSKRIKIGDIDICEYYSKGGNKNYYTKVVKIGHHDYFKIYDSSNPKQKKKIINGSEITHDGDNIGSTIRFYYTSKNGTNISRAKTGNKVPNADNVAVLQNIDLYDSEKNPIDYKRYIEISIEQLARLGVDYTVN